MLKCLEVLEHSQEQLESVGRAMTAVVEVMVYYIRFESLYESMKKDWLVAGELKSAVVEVYTNILLILGVARAYYKKKKSSNPSM